MPKSFKKDSMKKHFNEYFHLIKEVDLSNNAFLVNDVECDVPCIFQIWERKSVPRELIQKIEPNNFKFVDQSSEPAFQIDPFYKCAKV